VKQRVVRILCGLALLALSIAYPGQSHAADLPVDLELALAIDVSGSVDDEEAMLQRNGYIAAFRHPSIIDAISHGALGRIAVSYYEWAGFGHMKYIAGWTLINDKASAEAFAAKLGAEPPETARRTAIAAAITEGTASFDSNGFTARRRVIDISGDGTNNWGEQVTVARDRAVAKGVTINGLPIVNDRLSPSGRKQESRLDLYYRDCVIGGPGAFYVVARDFKDFPRAVLRKLMLEIAGLRPAPKRQLLWRAQMTAPPKSPDCDIGERRWPRSVWDDEDDFPLRLPPR
jgi:hypothetical protein